MHALAQVEGVDGLDEADAADLEEIVHALAAPGELLHYAQHQPEIPRDQFLASVPVTRVGLLQ